MSLRRGVFALTPLVVMALVACGALSDAGEQPLASFADASADVFATTDAEATTDVDSNPLPDASTVDAGEPVDASADAVSEPPEPPCFVGNVVIKQPSDATALAAFSCIEGSLEIATTSSIDLAQLRRVSGKVLLSTTSSDIAFPALETIGGELLAKASTPSTLRIPKVRDVGGRFAVVDSKLTTLYAPLLESVGGNLEIVNTPLTAVALPALRTIAGYAKFSSSGSNTLAFPNLESIGGYLGISGLSQLSSVSVPRLREVGGALGVSSSTAHLQELVFSALESVGTTIDIHSQDGWLDTLSFPKLTHAGAMTVRSTKIVTLSLPELVECGGLWVETVALETLRAPKLAKSTGRITSVPFGITVPLLKSIELPKLQTAEGVVLADLPHLATIDLSQLATLTGDMGLARLPRVAQLSLPLLTSVSALSVNEMAALGTLSAPMLTGGAKTEIHMEKDPKVTAVDLPAVASLYVLYLVELAGLANISLPAATSIGVLTIGEAPALTTASFAKLAAVNGVKLINVGKLPLVDVPQLASLSALEIRGTPSLIELGSLSTAPVSLEHLVLESTGLTTVSFPKLAAVGPLFLSKNPALTTLSLPELRQVSTPTAYVGDSPKLSACAVDEINGRLQTGSIGTYQLLACTP